MFVIAFVTIIALVATTLAAMNTGVRISFAMAQDVEMPDMMGLLHERYATPYVAVVMLVIFSSIIGIVGALGGITALMGIVIASNLGTFMLYAIVCILTVISYGGTESFNIFKHGLVPIVGAVANIGLAAAMLVVGMSAGGVARGATILALVLAGMWLVLNVAYFIAAGVRKGRS